VQDDSDDLLLWANVERHYQAAIAELRALRDAPEAAEHESRRG
jgi:hypothetical protein